jgi:hypothetical protein
MLFRTARRIITIIGPVHIIITPIIIRITTGIGPVASIGAGAVDMVAGTVVITAGDIMATTVEDSMAPLVAVAGFTAVVVAAVDSTVAEVAVGSITNQCGMPIAECGMAVDAMICSAHCAAARGADTAARRPYHAFFHFPFFLFNF